MTAAPSPCVCGCTVRGQHIARCPERCQHIAPPRPRLPRACPKGCDHTCRGCVPRAAEFGLLCAWDWQRLNGDIVDTPALVRYLWALAHSGETATAELKIRGGDPAEQGILHAALDALDGLHACLASWAHVILEEHPDGDRMAGPDDRGVRWTGTTKWIDPDVFPRLEDGSEPLVYVHRPEPASVRDPEATSRLVRWLLPMLVWCAAQEWVGEMRREVADVVRTTAARFPVVERTRAIPGVTCPVCERVSLVYDPATPERHSVQVNCTTRGCGVVFTQDEFKRLTGIIEWEHNQERMGA